jgi:hypothetical protein
LGCRKAQDLRLSFVVRRTATAQAVAILSHMLKTQTDKMNIDERRYLFNVPTVVDRVHPGLIIYLKLAQNTPLPIGLLPQQKAIASYLAFDTSTPLIFATAGLLHPSNNYCRHRNSNG